MPTKIQFRGELEFLSNFYPCKIIWRGEEFPSSEHLFMSFKTLCPVTAEAIRNAPTPGKAKRLGRKCQLRPMWEELKGSFMFVALIAKFHQNPELGDKLKKVSDADLVEWNIWHDNTWGDCTCEDCAEIKGENLLGQILRRVKRMI